MARSQLVFVPCPGMGHLVATVEFARLLIDHDDRLSITILIIKAPFNATMEAYTSSLTSSLSFLKRLQLITLPTYHDPTNSQSLHPSDFMYTLIESQKPHVKEAVSNLISDPDSPLLAGFVVDMFTTTMIDVADEFGVPAMVFFTSGAAFLGFMLHLRTLRERDNIDTTEFKFKDSGTVVTIPSFVNPVPASVFPKVVLHKVRESNFSKYARGLRKARGIIVNTFEELESYAVHSFSDSHIAVYPVGPILSLKGDTQTNTNDSAQQGSNVIEWLDDQPPSSVIFLCFGSRTYFDEDDQVREIARALERSGFRFLWSLRKPSPKDSVKTPSDYSDLMEVLPEGFLERTAGIGRVIGWAPQAQILAHQAIGGFVSHCGWNSILESIYFGVPVATWPLEAEQQMNAFELVHELKMAVEISSDYMVGIENGSKSGIVSAERIEKGITDVMEKESEVRRKVKEMSEISRTALKEGGSSYSYLGRLIDDIMNSV